MVYITHITPLVINDLGGGHTGRHTHTYQCANQSNFKKPGKHRPAADTHLVKKHEKSSEKTMDGSWSNEKV